MLFDHCYWDQGRTQHSEALVHEQTRKLVEGIEVQFADRTELA
jgi:hypothetical protein